MNKKLYIRFFIDGKAEIPYDSHIVWDGRGTRTIAERIADYAEDIADWLLKYPDGKVDFVWL